MVMFYQSLVQYWYLYFTGSACLVLLGFFIVRFMWPKHVLHKEVSKSITELKKIWGLLEGAVVDLDEIAEKAMPGPTLSNLWREYIKTLHRQSKENEQGQQKIACWRATALAETFFSDQAVVETPLKTEFFNHLPGIFTGIGIIGTFVGLISGLSRFDVSLNPTAAQDQLSTLVNTVGHAFIISGSAIFLAIVVTIILKLSLSSCYSQTEQLRASIDNMFMAGAGEEYLERIMDASEASETQAKHIKDALVSDLKEILTTLTTQQIEAQGRHGEQLSVEIGEAIKKSLSGPMESISQAVKGVSATQGDAINRALTDVLTDFSAKMHDMFGGQMQGMSDLLVKTSEAMQATAQKFDQLAANMDSTGTDVIDAMSDRLNKTLDVLDAKQQTMNAQMGIFVEQIREAVANSQYESARKLQESLSAVGEKMTTVVGELHRQAEASSVTQREIQSRFEESTGDVIHSLSAQMEQLLGQSMETNKALRLSVESFTSVTDKAISGMNSGAETLYLAAGDFAKAGQGVSETMRHAASAVATIKSTADELSQATLGAIEIVADYGNTRDVFKQMVSDLRTTIETARRDASMTSEIVRSIEAATNKLAEAHGKTGDYLKGINDVLVGAHKTFAENIRGTLREGNLEFQNELTQSVQLLSGAIKSLSDLVDDIPARR